MRRRQKLVTVLLFSAAPLLPACMTEEPGGEQVDDTALIQLRDELLNTPAQTALATMDHFRPICDAEGYPLVGNVATKAIGLQPSQFCEQVRIKQ